MRRFTHDSGHSCRGYRRPGRSISHRIRTIPDQRFSQEGDSSPSLPSPSPLDRGVASVSIHSSLDEAARGGRTLAPGVNPPDHLRQWHSDQLARDALSTVAAKNVDASRLAPPLAWGAASPPIFSSLDEAVWGARTVGGHYTPKDEHHEVLRYRCKGTMQEEGKDLECTHWRFVSTQGLPWTFPEHGKHTNHHRIRTIFLGFRNARFLYFSAIEILAFLVEVSKGIPVLQDHLEKSVPRGGQFGTAWAAKGTADWALGEVLDFCRLWYASAV